jgi:hypothetical protein
MSKLDAALGLDGVAKVVDNRPSCCKKDARRPRVPKGVPGIFNQLEPSVTRRRLWLKLRSCGKVHWFLAVAKSRAISP